MTDKDFISLDPKSREALHTFNEVRSLNNNESEAKTSKPRRSENLKKQQPAKEVASPIPTKRTKGEETVKKEVEKTYAKIGHSIKANNLSKKVEWGDMPQKEGKSYKINNGPFGYRVIQNEDLSYGVNALLGNAFSTFFWSNS